MSALNDKILEAKAYKLRNEFGLSLSDPIDFDKLLLSMGVIVSFTKLSKNFSGMSLKMGKMRFMMVNINQQLARQHFTIGHELYHLFEQADFKHQICKTGIFEKKDKEEYNADVFSSYFLMPEAGIMNIIPETELGWGGKLSLLTILKLEQHFGVSRAAMLIRLERMGLLRQGEADIFKTDVKKSAKENGYPLDIYELTNKEYVLGDYGIRAKRIFDKEVISESHYFELMHEINIDVEKNEEDEQGGA